MRNLYDDVVCKADGCTERAAVKDMCPPHYDRQRRYGTTDPPPPRPRLPVGQRKIPVSTSVLTDQYAELDRRAVARGTTVAQVLRELVDAAVPAPPPQVKGGARG